MKTATSEAMASFLLPPCVGRCIFEVGIVGGGDFKMRPSEAAIEDELQRINCRRDGTACRSMHVKLCCAALGRHALVVARRHHVSCVGSRD